MLAVAARVAVQHAEAVEVLSLSAALGASHDGIPAAGAFAVVVEMVPPPVFDPYVAAFVVIESLIHAPRRLRFVRVFVLCCRH
jgi:hypothetical protein